MGLVQLKRQQVGFFDPPINGLFLRIPDLKSLALAVDLLNLFDDYFAEVDLFLSGDELIFDALAPAYFLQFFHGLCVGQEEWKVELVLLCSFRRELKRKDCLALGIDAQRDDLIAL